MANVLAREVWTWSILSGAETAQAGWYLFSATAADISDVVSSVNSVTDPWAVWRANIPASAVVTERELVETDVATGAVLSTHSLTLPASPAGSLAGFTMPPQVAEVVTIHTIVPGRSGRGRFYLPPLGTATGTAGGRMNTVNRDSLATGFATYVSDLQAASVPVQVGVYSRKLHAFSGSTNIAVGDVFDTQRGRRNSLVEAVITLP
jgi:hypothetical protein